MRGEKEREIKRRNEKKREETRHNENEREETRRKEKKTEEKIKNMTDLSVAQKRVNTPHTSVLRCVLIEDSVLLGLDRGAPQTVPIHLEIR